jgi:hypothetical protein
LGASNRTLEALGACRELPGRRALPAAPGGGVLAAMAAAGKARGRSGLLSGACAQRLPAGDARARPAVSNRVLRGRFAAWAVALATTAISLVFACPVPAEEVFTSQAAAANATDSTWIPAPAQRAAVCVVDTGNDPNPDTSNVVARLSVDGEPGTDRSPDHHGTLMSMIAAAPYNGFGMVGAAPSINVVSVRASRDGVSFGGTDLARAIQRCVAFRNTYNIKVISLSLGGAVVSGLDAGGMATVEDMVSSARFVGLDVVAAAGNHRGVVDWPAGYGPVLAIGAADNVGARCSFAASGPEVDLWASGCPLDAALFDGAAAWASGSSESTAFVAGALTQLRQLSPGSTVDQAEQALMSSAQIASAGSRLDVGAAFAAVGLEGQLALGHTMVPQVAQSGGATDPQLPASTGPSVGTIAMPLSGGHAAGLPVIAPLGGERSQARLPKPSVVSVRLRRAVLSMRFKNKPRGMVAQVQIYTRTKRRAFPALVDILHVMDDRFRTPVSGTVSQVSITYRDPQRIRGSSVLLSLHSVR